MKSYQPAKKCAEAFSFGADARWIHDASAERAAHVFFRRTFELSFAPKQAVLLAMAAGYAEITVNGQYAAGLAERSYIFRKAYEVYDVTPYLREGRNVIAVMAVSTGEPVRDGFALELCADGARLAVSDGTWLKRRDDSVEPVDYYLSGVPEVVDGERRREDMTAPHYDDSAWAPADVIGNELLHAPYEHFYQHKTKAQTAALHTPVAVTAVRTAARPRGYALKFGPSQNGITCAMARFSLEAPSSLTLLPGGNFRGISLDGVPAPMKKAIALSAGTHLLTVAFSWTQELFLQTDAAISFESPSGAPFEAVLLKTPPVRYPWNEYRGPSDAEQRAKAILAATDFAALGGETMPLTPTAADSAVSDFLFRTYAIPQDGFADERLIRKEGLSQTDECVRVSAETFLSGGEMTFSPNDVDVNVIFDFGTEQVGQFSFALCAPAGLLLSLHVFEMITDAGILYMGNGQTLRYRTREGEQSFRSGRRLGFRYLSLLVPAHTRPLTLRSLSVTETRYPVEKADFSCSDETLCRVFEMAARTAEVCMLDLYVDCPGYEQNPWTGDGRVTAQVNLNAFGAYDFDAEYLRTIALSLDDGLCRVYRTGNPRYQSRQFLPCACFPTYPEGCIPVWSFQWLLQVFDHYEATSDLELLRELYPAVRETLARCTRMIDDRGLFDMQGAWNLIEWANNDLSFFGEAGANSMMLAFCFEKAAEAARLFSDGETAAQDEKTAARLREAINRYLWDEDARAYIDTARDEYAYRRYVSYMESRGMATMPYEQFASQKRISVQTNTFAILYKAAPTERLQDAKRFLLDNLKTGRYVAGTPSDRTFGAPDEAEAPDGYVHIGSPFFLFFALDALYRLGEDALSLTVQARDYGAFLARGLTTCLENFPKGDNWTRSVAHAWSASPAVYLLREVLGVKPAKPGYAEFTVEPHAAWLRSAKGSVPTPHGRIFVSWERREDGSLAIQCRAPEGCRRI